MRRTPTAAGVLLVLAAATGCAGTAAQPSTGTPAPSVTADTPAPPGTSSREQTPNGSPEAESAPGSNPQQQQGDSSGVAARTAAPKRLHMPSIGFDRSLASLGVDAQGQINPPEGVVQWYNKSVVPGAKGISVIAGHVEYNGPDVFAELDQLDVGDIVTVDYADGSSRRFRVYAEEPVNKKTLQTDRRVWGTSDKPILALITCDSASQVVGNHHTDNYVVWAAPVEGNA